MHVINKINRCLLVALSLIFSVISFAMEENQNKWAPEGDYLTTLSRLGHKNVQVNEMGANFSFSLLNEEEAKNFSKFLHDEVQIKGQSGQKWVKIHYPSINRFGVVLTTQNIEELENYLTVVNNIGLLEKLYEEKYRALTIKYKKINNNFYFSFNYFEEAQGFKKSLPKEILSDQQSKIDIIDVDKKSLISLTYEQMQILFRTKKGALAGGDQSRANKK